MALKDTLLELAPHYLAMFLLVSIVLVVARTVVDLGFWGELAVIAVIVFLYPFVVRRLGYEPSVWQKR